MPRLIALQDNTLPPGIIGPPVVAAGRMVTVSQEEAATLLAGGGWEVYTPPEKTAPLLDKTERPAVRKVVEVAEEVAPDGSDNH